MKKTTFIKLYSDEMNAIEFLSDNVAGRVIKSIVKYARTGASPRTSDEVVLSLFEIVKNHIDEDRKEYSELCQKYSENAKKRYNKGVNNSEKPSTEKSCNGKPLQLVEEIHDDITNVIVSQTSDATTIIEEPQTDTSFEHLWKTYNHPKSIREIAEITWNEFSEEEKEAAIEYIPKYRIEHAKDKHFPYLAKYLRQKPWQCDGKMK